jgi:hypothetical protein
MNLLEDYSEKKEFLKKVLNIKKGNLTEEISFNKALFSNGLP